MSTRTKPTKAAIYARISNDPEGREAGVTRQVEDCNDLIEKRGWGKADLPPFIDNDVSASTLSKKRRPSYEQLLDLVRLGEVDAIVYYTTSRLTRRPREYEDLIELYRDTGVTLASVKSFDVDLSSADGRMLARSLAVQDTAEAERISERVSRANEGRRKEGRPEPSSRAFGWEKGGETIVEREAVLIREAVARIIDEGWSLGQVVADWNKRKVPTLRGAGQWSRVTVKRALTSPRTAGLLSLRGEVIGEGKFGRIITPEDREKVIELCTARRQGNATTYKQRIHVLAGFLVCGKCSRPMKVNAMYAEDGSYRADSFVVCSRTQYGCGNVKRNFGHIMEYIDEVIRAKIDMFEPEVSTDEDGHEREAQVAELESRLAEIEADIEDAEAAFAAREIRFGDYNRVISTLRDQEEAVRRAIGQASESAHDSVEEADLLPLWEHGTVEEKRLVLAKFVDHIRVMPIGKIGPIRAKAGVHLSTQIIPAG